MKEQSIFGNLFNTIPLLTENHLDILLKTIDVEQSKYILTQAVTYAYHNGVYSLGESEVISKCLRVLNTPENTKETEE